MGCINGIQVLLTNLTNGKTYEICQVARDEVGNSSVPSNTITAKPVDECDFIECYPGHLKPAYCGAASAPAWVVMAFLARWRRRRMRPSCTE